MLNQADTTKAVKGLRTLARKNGDTGGDVDALLAENMGLDKSVIERIALGEATQGDFILAAAALAQVASEMGEPETTATKASFGDEQWHREHAELGRDAFGRALTKVHGSSPADVRARKEGRVSPLDQGDNRTPDGRSIKKVYG